MKRKRCLDGLLLGERCGCANRVCYYTKRDQIWERIAYREELEESRVPPELLARAGYDRELDITDELNLKLM